MPSGQGHFVWHDLMTSDPEAAGRFYERVVGWTAEDAGMAWPYTLLKSGGHTRAGMMALPEDAKAGGGRPGWIGHIGADDVDAMTEKVREAGGSVHREPSDIPGVGRFSAVADPYGATFCIFTASAEMQANAPERPAPGTPGTVAWHELMAGDLDGAWSFYSGLFGWTKGEGMDMGPMGIYQLFEHDGASLGAMMRKPEEVPACFWLYYFAVDSIDAATARVTEAGGHIANGPMEVPGGTWIVQCIDPQGAMFALNGPR